MWFIGGVWKLPERSARPAQRASETERSPALFDLTVGRAETAGHPGAKVVPEEYQPPGEKTAQAGVAAGQASAK